MFPTMVPESYAEITVEYEFSTPIYVTAMRIQESNFVPIEDEKESEGIAGFHQNEKT